ncbi:MAG TPA: hypothetical protein VH371_12280 [Candidatus Limnocylindrales bacterium]
MNQQSPEFTARQEFTRQELDAIGDYLPEIRRSLSDQSILRFYLIVAFVLGLLAQVVGYLLKVNAGADLYGLAVDLLYALGWAMWTGVVVTLFVQVLPEAKRRQIIRGLEAYEASKRDYSRDSSAPPV